MGFSPFFYGANKTMLNRRSDKLELLRIAEAVALEKSIDKELIIDSINWHMLLVFQNLYLSMLIYLIMI